jgi:hypothetical protein
MAADSLPQLSSTFWLAAIVLWFALSVLYRIYAKKPMFATVGADCKFSEKWASGRFGTGVVARLGTAKNCIHVRVTDKTIEIHPQFPFTLGFMPEIYNLDHSIPLENVRSVIIMTDGRMKALEMKYKGRNGSDQVAQLLLKNAASFIQHATAKSAST